MKIILDKCEIRKLYFYFVNVIRQLYVLQTKVIHNLKVIVKERKEHCDDFAFINTVVENSQIGGWILQMSGDTSIGFVKFYNTDIAGYIISEGGLGYLHFDNCTFTHKPIYVKQSIKVESGLQVRIINCKFMPAGFHHNCENTLGCVI